MPKKIPADFNTPLYPNLVQPLPQYLGGLNDYTAKNNAVKLTDNDKVSDNVTRTKVTDIDNSTLNYNVNNNKPDISNEPVLYGIPKSKKSLNDDSVY